LNKENPLNKYRISNPTMSIENVVHEVQLRMDLAKMRFNNILMKFPFHQYLKKLMFKKEDLYFMKSNSEKQKQNNHIINNIKGVNKIKSKKRIIDDKTRENLSTTYASSSDYSRFEDSEKEPLNI
jgi:hypothetical protein